MRVRTFKGCWATTEGCHIVVVRDDVEYYYVSLAWVGATQGNSVINVAINLDGDQALELARQIAYADVCGRKSFDPLSKSEIGSWNGFELTDEDILEDVYHPTK